MEEIKLDILYTSRTSEATLNFLRFSYRQTVTLLELPKSWIISTDTKKILKDISKRCGARHRSTGSPMRFKKTSFGRELAKIWRGYFHVHYVSKQKSRPTYSRNQVKILWYNMLRLFRVHLWLVSERPMVSFCTDMVCSLNRPSE